MRSDEFIALSDVDDKEESESYNSGMTFTSQNSDLLNS